MNYIVTLKYSLTEGCFSRQQFKHFAANCPNPYKKNSASVSSFLSSFSFSASPSCPPSKTCIIFYSKGKRRTWLLLTLPIWGNHLFEIQLLCILNQLPRQPHPPITITLLLNTQTHLHIRLSTLGINVSHWCIIVSLFCTFTQALFFSNHSRYEYFHFIVIYTGSKCCNFYSTTVILQICLLVIL